MKKKPELNLFIIFVIPLMLVPITSQAGISSNTEICDSGMAGVECRKIVTEYRDDGSNEWLKAGVVFQFRSTNGESCNVHGQLTNAKNVTGSIPSALGSLTQLTELTVAFNTFLADRAHPIRISQVDRAQYVTTFQECIDWKYSIRGVE